ncbi:MAG: DNA polymerase III subunit delta' [Armatimonadota bacterium]|nr:DNA polymerase III subunit delta' [Armatimonadota bacterium]
MAFRDVVNQDHAVLLFRRAHRLQRVSHAYLLVGPSGVGRRSLALAFAQLLNCERPDGDACGECPACQKIARGTHPDVRTLDVARGQYLEVPGKDYKGREIPVDQIRALRQDAAYPPYEGRWKVYIVADAEKMSASAANSLLKTLEEPPPRVTVILIAESSVALLPTIVSRCQLVRCAHLRTDQIEKALIERWQMDPARARVLAALADGRLGRALEWARSEDRLEARDRLLDLLPALETGDMLQRLDAAEALSKQADLLPELLDLAVLWYRDLLIWRQLKEPRLLTNLDRQEQIALLADQQDEATLAARIEAVEAAKDSLRRNVNPRLVLEKLFLAFGPPLGEPQRSNR